MKLNHVKAIVLNEEYWVDVIWGGTLKQQQKFAIQKFCDDSIPMSMFGSGRGSVLRRPEYNPLIVMNITPKDKHFWATLAHESVHAIDEIWKMIEENAERHEVFAHSVGAVVAAVEKKLR